ncbi:MAG: hypothetical protein KAS32_03610, partial [Candidatus Peribacteraceae bacterium]|nr:hypothetical protein [Candidatus Peribacteraceae bacterium]
KTLTFAADPSSYYSAADRIEVVGATIKTYNGRFVVSSVDASNNQITYTGAVPLTQSSTADGGITLQAEINETNTSRYRELLIHPSISTESHNIHIDYIKQVIAMENDADEPLIPLEDRAILLYGALHKAWARERNPEEAARNLQLFAGKIVQMRGDLDESTDHVTLMVSKHYLGTKRNRMRFPLNFKRFD